MKKIYIITLVCILAYPVMGQVKFGVFLDPQVGWMSPESREVTSKGSIINLSGGLSVDNYFAKNYALSSGIAIGNQGGKLSFDELRPIRVYDEVDTLEANTELQYKLQYITVPLGLKLKSNQIGYFTYYVNVGLTSQLNIRAKASSADGSISDDSIKEEIGLFNLSYHFGGGVEYGLGKDSALLLGVIYHNGFLDATTTNPTVYTRVLSLRLGLLF